MEQTNLFIIMALTFKGKMLAINNKNEYLINCYREK